QRHRQTEQGCAVQAYQIAALYTAVAVVMKIIFLDFDGPLSNVRVTLGYGADDRMDPVTLRALNHICEASGAKIVCTSVRAVLHPGRYQDCMWRFKQAGLDLSHVHRDWSCNTDNGGNRYEQIEAWLAAHEGVTHYAVVDDEQVLDRQGHNHPKLVKTSMNDGMAFRQFQRLAKLLDFDLLLAFDKAREWTDWGREQMVLPFDFLAMRHNASMAIRRIDNTELVSGLWHKTDTHSGFVQFRDASIFIPVRHSFPSPAEAFSIAVNDLRQDQDYVLYVRHGIRVQKAYMPE
ncbi:MAG: hypothetical protein JWO78_1058, partial [Micavibrio sp.]|nr:hypothetical protein [Micavibrio sp.]